MDGWMVYEEQDDDDDDEVTWPRTRSLALSYAFTKFFSGCVCIWNEWMISNIHWKAIIVYHVTFFILSEKIYIVFFSKYQFGLNSEILFWNPK